MFSCEVCEMFIKTLILKNILWTTRLLLFLLSHFWIMDKSNPNSHNGKIGVIGDESTKAVKVLGWYNILKVTQNTERL